MNRNPKQVSIFLLIYLILYLSLAIASNYIVIPYVDYVLQFLPVVIGLIYLIITRRNPIQELHLRPCRLLTFPLIILYTFLLYPLVAVLNSLSMLFTTNIIDSTVNETVSTHGLVFSLITMALFPALVEEFVFRGILFGGWRGNRPLKAILLSALCFGLMHMNFNQMIYAVVLGIFLALAVEASGSLFASILMHFTFNSVSVLVVYFTLSSTAADAVNAMNDTITDPNEIYETCITLLPFAAGGLILAILVLMLIARINGRKTDIRSLFHAGSRMEGEATRLRCVWLYVYIIICLIVCISVQLTSQVSYL